MATVRRAVIPACLLALVVGLTLAAPIYSSLVADTGPLDSHLNSEVWIGDQPVRVGQRLAPTWSGRFLVGGDDLGRDVAVRVLFGGRTSLIIGTCAALLTAGLGLGLGLIAGFSGGWVDRVISILLDVIWAFPVVLLSIALGSVLSQSEIRLGPLSLERDSILPSILVIAIVYVPYMARPIRAEVRSLTQRPFIEASRAAGGNGWHILRRELLPNVLPVAVVYLPLLVSNAILLEAALSYLGVGVRPPRPSWGSILHESTEVFRSAPHLFVVPGVMLLLTTWSLNSLADVARYRLLAGKEAR